MSPGQGHMTFGTTIRITRSHHPSCLSCRADDLRFLWTIGDRWCPLMPVPNRWGTDPVRTEGVRSRPVADAIAARFSASRGAERSAGHGKADRSLPKREPEAEEPEETTLVADPNTEGGLHEGHYCIGIVNSMALRSAARQGRCARPPQAGSAWRPRY
jgi:hypothetical protein